LESGEYCLSNEQKITFFGQVNPELFFFDIFHYLQYTLEVDRQRKDV